MKPHIPSSIKSLNTNPPNMTTAPLPSRYEIRQLGPEHAEWAQALVTHSNMFYSRLWTVIYPENKTARAYATFHGTDYLVAHQIDSGLSLGVFDKEWTPKYPESAATGGKLHWNFDDETADAEKLLEQMDFPLVSVALSYDSINALDMSKMGGAIAALPAFASVYGGLAAKDKRDPQTWAATEAGQVLFRNATSTRREHEGKGLMKILAHYLMHKSAKEGFRGIQIEAVNDAVTHVWSKPPAPYSGEIVSTLDSATYEEQDDQGNKSYPLQPSEQIVNKIYVALK